MRFTQKLFAQHLGWTFKKHWQVQGQRVPRDTGALSKLCELGIQVSSASDVVNPKNKFERIDYFGSQHELNRNDETHPHWNNQAAHIYGDSNVLLEGLPQAQILTNTIEINGLPPNIEESIAKMEIASIVDRRVRKILMASYVYDTQQMKLQKLKLVERPGYNLPRDYGISEGRKNRLLINKLISECEKLVGPSVTSVRRLMDNVNFKVSLQREDDILQFDILAEKMITTTHPINGIRGKYEGEIPDLHPIKCTITIPKKNIYNTNNNYPFRDSSAFSHPHTIFLHFDKEFVGNLHETCVTTTQFQSRTLLKAFGVAASKAKYLYGEAFSEQLPKPIVVQSIQSDGKTFHFGILQLNTLSLHKKEGPKNYWFHLPLMDLFSECGYNAGRPTLIGYNKEVFRLLNAFYNNF